MYKITTTALLSIFTMAILSSCQLKSPRQESWTNPEFEGHTLGKTVILGIADSEARCQQVSQSEPPTRRVVDARHP